MIIFKSLLTTFEALLESSKNLLEPNSHYQVELVQNEPSCFFRTSILKIDDVSDVITEAPAKLSNSILLFVKGLGWLTSVNLPNVERR
jgi:hypothetical protein